MTRKAVVPIAGRGSRLWPITSVVPKALLPLVDRLDQCRPVLHWILAEAAEAGIEHLAVVVSPEQTDLIERYLAAAASAAPALPACVELLVQDRPLGFGDAVLRAAATVGGESFLLMLGDHVRAPGANQARQVLEAFERLRPAAMIGMQPVGEDELSRVGVAGGEAAGEGVYRCRQFAEKPSAETARAHLRTPGLPDGQFLAHSGLYAFSPEIFDCLRQVAPDGAGEIALADAQSLLLRRRKDDYYLYRVRGRSLDVGTPENYAAAFAEFRTL